MTTAATDAPSPTFLDALVARGRLLTFLSNTAAEAAVIGNMADDDALRQIAQDIEALRIELNERIASAFHLVYTYERTRTERTS